MTLIKPYDTGKRGTHEIGKMTARLGLGIVTP